ncbi:hypothetical protein PHYSODRAFT_507300, partial [Phytophthora sojae]
PLLAVTLVFRSKAKFFSRSHAVDAVSLFLDSSVELPFDRACEFDSLKLLDRIWSSSDIFATENKELPEKLPWTLRRYIRTDRFYCKTKLQFSFIEAIELENLELVRWLLDKFEDIAVIDGKVVLETMSTISIEVLQLIDSYKYGVRHVEWDQNTMAEAISEGRNDIVWWLQQHFPNEDFNKAEALMQAVLKEDIVMAEWLIDHGAQWRRPFPGDNIGHEMAARGRLDILKWLTQGGRLDHRREGSAWSGFLNVFKWLHDNRSKGCTEKAMELAAARGHLRVVRWLQAHRSNAYANSACGVGQPDQRVPLSARHCKMHREYCVDGPRC